MKIAVITGTRAEYGIMRKLINMIYNDDFFNVEIIVTGMHLEEKYGLTYKNIEKDGFNISHKVFSEMSSSSSQGVLNSISKTIEGFSNIFTTNKYDSILVLGDRYEILAACISASIYRIPIIHLHGGETTEGNYDEFIRHSITKMSHLHLASTEKYRQRIIQLGENPNTVYNVGSLGVENIIDLTPSTAIEISNAISFDIEKGKYFVVAFHPETLTGETNEKLLKVLENYNDYKIILIGTNSDLGADECFENMTNFCKRNNNAKIVNSLTQDDFFSLVKSAALFIGNSSSGIIEIPSLCVPNVNIGDRQKGRIQANSTFNSLNTKESINEAIISALNFNGEYRNPYFKLEVANNIVNIIKKTEFNIVKSFYDIND